MKCLNVSECEDLIRHMLLIDPERRLAMRDVINHKWMRMRGEDVEFERLIATSLDAVDYDEVLNELVLQHMETLGIERQQTVEVRSVT